MTIDLNSNWIMIDGENSYPCSVPCSAFKTLMDNGVMEDPYYRTNETAAAEIAEREFVFRKEFDLDDAFLRQDRLYLTFGGIDTLADVYLNDTYLGSCDNMHRTYEYDVRGIADFHNVLIVWIHSPVRYIIEKQSERPLIGVKEAMEGYPHLRKAHYMVGWDWGPKLPDMGIWRSVKISGYNGGRIRSVRYTQEHTKDKVLVKVNADLDVWSGGVRAEVVFVSPGDVRLTSEMINGRLIIEISDPQLWWVRGLGEQPLYVSEVRLISGKKVLDSRTDRIGLRTLTVSQDKDKWGSEFCFVNNGVKVFAMGANYIPEDHILPNCTKERTDKLLKECLDANFNFIRVWGGGYYPSDSFYDFCDEHGLIVWQDFMFACSAYLLTLDFEATVKAEVTDNVIRLRNHPSLGLWCGNNEIESAWEYWGWNDPEGREHYSQLFEEIIPGLLLQLDPFTFYWPSSPSSGGGFHEPSSNKAGDMHYWAVWHDFKPIEDFRRLYYRFCSEYGFESIPDIKTCLAFCDPDKLDLSLNSPVMKLHQKCDRGMEKLKYYMDQYVGVPRDFEHEIYLSQLVQADCIRSNVEHMRRARGRCMGSAYWQFNDSNPVISWSSVDYFGRRKALHYYAKRFYAPLLLSCDDRDPLHPTLYVTNDTPVEEALTVTCRVRNNFAEVLEEFTADIISDPLGTVKALRPDLSKHLRTEEDKRNKYIEYRLENYRRELAGGTTLFVHPKDFLFMKPGIYAEVFELQDVFAVTLIAESFAKSVCLSLSETDCKFSDNWFDIHGDEEVTVKIPKQPGLTAGLIREQLKIMSC